jgi:hypothetical protein
MITLSHFLKLLVKLRIVILRNDLKLSYIFLILIFNFQFVTFYIFYFSPLGM